MSQPQDILRAVAAPDLSAPIVWLPIRHHSPACAHQVAAVIRQVRPATVLIEGPRDATPLVRHLSDSTLVAPVALFTTYADRRGDGQPRRTAAYYPLCAYSPELVAITTANEVGAQTRFIDLTWPEQVHTAQASSEPVAHPQSLQHERALRQGTWLTEACRRSRVRDPDDLWDAWFESDGREREPAAFFRDVLAWCTACRLEHSPGELSADGNLVREAAMRAEIDRALREVPGRMVVVTGGFHTVALPQTAPAMPPAVTIKNPEDVGTWLMRYDFVQLDRLNGYASGMPSPGFWQWRWEGADLGELLVTIARELRAGSGSPSVADTAAAVSQLQRLAAFRGHRRPTRYDLLDAVTSLFIKGARDIEGVAVLAKVRKLLAGDRVGVVPASVGRPPLVLDFERQVAVLRCKLSVEEHGLDLDLYRSAGHRETSRFLHRLLLLEVPFAHKDAGPDFAAGTDLHRVREIWRYQWNPAVEARLVECSRYGATVEGAATALLLEQVQEIEQGERRSERAARLVVEACRCGLHAQARHLLPQLHGLISNDSDVSSVIAASNHLHLLVTGREPLEAHELPAVDTAVLMAWTRASYLITGLAKVAQDAEDDACQDLLSWSVLTESLSDPTCPGLRLERLIDVSRGDNPAVAGTAHGLLYDDGQVDGAELARHLAGHLAAATRDPSVGGRFLRGVLCAARSACWNEPALIDAVHVTLRDLAEDQFTAVLPHLRLAFAELPPRAVDRVAKQAGARAGLQTIALHQASGHTLAEVQLGRRGDLLVRQALEHDGLADLLGDHHG